MRREDLRIINNLDLTTILSASNVANSKALISSAFIKANAFEKICQSINPNCKKVIIARWQFRDLICGASDLEVYLHAQKYGWKFYFNQDLHAKLYIFDNRSFIGSSNLTNKGLGGAPPNGNIELSVEMTVTDELMNWFDNLLQKSVLVDDELFEAINGDVSTYKEEEKIPYTTRRGFSQNVLTLLKKRKTHPKLYLHDLPQIFDPNELTESTFSSKAEAAHDLTILGLSVKPSIAQIKNAFKVSPGFAWLLTTIETSMFFGEITANLHNSLCDEPKPYRRDVKIRLANLINWAAILCPEVFTVDTPNHSQRVSNISNLD